MDTALEAKTQFDTHSIVRYNGYLHCVRISARFWGIFTVKSDWLVYYYKEVNKFWLAHNETLRTGNFKKSHSAKDTFYIQWSQQETKPMGAFKKTMWTERPFWKNRMRFENVLFDLWSLYFAQNVVLSGKVIHFLSLKLKKT